MIPSIRNGILAIEGTGSDVDDDMSGDEKQDNEVNVLFYQRFFFSVPSSDTKYCSLLGSVVLSLGLLAYVGK